jgi:hypothetical protein
MSVFFYVSISSLASRPCPCPCPCCRINCVVLSLHPGTVDTDLSKPFQGNVAQSKLFTPQHSVACMLDVVGSITDAKDGGKFFAYDGSEIPF